MLFKTISIREKLPISATFRFVDIEVVEEPLWSPFALVSYALDGQQAIEAGRLRLDLDKRVFMSTDLDSLNGMITCEVMSEIEAAAPKIVNMLSEMRAKEAFRKARIIQLAANRVRHEREIRAINVELSALLQEEIENMEL